MPLTSNDVLRTGLPAGAVPSVALPVTLAPDARTPDASTAGLARVEPGISAVPVVGDVFGEHTQERPASHLSLRTSDAISADPASTEQMGVTALPPPLLHELEPLAASAEAPARPAVPPPVDDATRPNMRRRGTSREGAALLRGEVVAPPPPGVVLDVVAAAAAGMAHDPVVGSAAFFDELSSGRLPAYRDDNDPLTERTDDPDADDRHLGTPFDNHPSVFDQSGEGELTDEGATVEGGPVVEDAGTDVGPPPPASGDVLRADDGSMVRLEDSLGEQAGSVFFRARIDGDEQPFTAVWMPTTSPEPPWSHLPDPRIVRPRCRVSLERAAIRVFERPKGNTVVDYLADDDRVLPAMATVELGIELAELLEGLHGAGMSVLDLDPSQIVIERGGRVRLYAVSGLYRSGSVPTGQLGQFCAPEVRRRLSYRVGAHSDVYAVALLLYALLAKRAPVDVDTDPAMLVSPRVFRPECPLGIWPALKPCLEGNPQKRVGHARGLRERLEHARRRLLNEAYATEKNEAVILESWAEMHGGLAKLRRGSGQQDRAVCLTDQRNRVGLYIIADGVSRSRFGDGAFAAEQIDAAAQQRWSALEKAGPAALDLNHAQRSDVLKQIARTAGKRISTEVNARCAPLANEPNQVMSSTMSALFVASGEATLGNLGDSRAYLIRDGTIEQVGIDHDRTTDALRMGLTFKEAALVQMGSALTRVVGRVIIDEDGTSRPDPFDPELFRVRLLPGDRIVLCSDGIADFVAGTGATDDEAEAKILETVLAHDDPGRAAFELVVLSNRVGGFDNISCVVIAAHRGS